MNISRNFTLLEKLLISCIAALHLVLVTPIVEVLPIIKEDTLIPKAEAQIMNIAPVISSVNNFTTENITLKSIDEGETLFIVPSVFDPDGDKCNITFINLIKLPGEEPVDVADFNTTGVWKTSYTDNGNYRATIRVEDSEGQITTKDIFFTINNKYIEPSIDISLDKNSVVPGEEFSISVTANDHNIFSSSFTLPDYTTTYVGSAALDTNIKKFGAASLFLDGDDDYITIADSDNWDLAGSNTDNWTIDFWTKLNTVAVDQTFLCQWQNGQNFYQFKYHPSIGVTFLAYKDNQLIIHSYTNETLDTEWHHIALIKKANEYSIYVDGLQKTNTRDDDTGVFAGPLQIGTRGGGDDLDGHIDELRIHHSNIFNANPNSGYTDKITLPIGPHLFDEDTKLFLSFNSLEEEKAVYFTPILLINDAPVLDIPETIEGAINFNKEYTIGNAGIHKITARIKDPVSKLTYEDSAYIEVAPQSQSGDSIKPVSGDFNGDGMTDIGYLDITSGNWLISLSDNGAFSAPQVWASNFGRTEYVVSLGGDFNGDGLADIALLDSRTGHFKIKFSNGSSFVDGKNGLVWAGTKHAITSYVDGADQCSIPFTGDFNGDGLTDLGCYFNRVFNADFNEGGHKFISYATKDASGNITFGDFNILPNRKNRDCIPIAADFNGDGFTDLCLRQDANKGTWFMHLNTTKDMVYEEIRIDNFGAGKETLAGDFNNDGITDIGYFEKEEGKAYYRSFKGDKFAETNHVYLSGLENSTETETNLIATTGDYNGDAILDAATFNKTRTGINKWSLNLHNSRLPDLLTVVDNGIGGTTAIEYAYSTTLDNTGDDDKCDLPFPVRVVKKVTKTTGTDTYATEYFYRDGFFETTTREFRGFGYVKQVDSEQSYKETYFYQDDTRKGRPKKELVYDKYERLYNENKYTWHYVGTDKEPTYRMVWGGLIPFPTLEEKETIVYNPQDISEFKSTRVKHDYDEYGNVITVKEEGFLDEENDEKETTITYDYTLETKHILSKPASSVIARSAEGATKQSKTRYTYDDLGSLKKEERYLDSNDKWIATNFTYDDYGNVITVTDALGRVTTTTYESTKTFPASVKNTIGHTQSFKYDYTSGKIKKSIDPNSQTTVSSYDNFGRLLKVTGPGGISEVEYTYDLSMNQGPVSITTTTVVVSGVKQSSTSYVDGLGRTIETISEADNGKYILSGLVKYDSRGQVIEKYLPAYTTGTDYIPPTYESKFVKYEYDPLGRVVTTIRPDGKVSINTYGITTTESRNENSQRKRVTKDAYGRIVTVEEFNDDDTVYSTTKYTYDLLGNLIKTEDTLGNVTEIKYDSLGRKTDMNDPDMGEYWKYIYDDVGNLRWQKDNKGNILGFKYDAINRLETKGQVSAIGVEPVEGVNYRYDLNANGKGRLSKAIDSSGTTEFFYDILGREIKTVKNLGTVPNVNFPTGGDCPQIFTIIRTHDSLDRLTSVTYPEDKIPVTYEYNKQGGIKKVYQGNDVIYLNEAKYNANGQIKEIEYGNRTFTRYDYDPNNLRLEKLGTYTSKTMYDSEQKPDIQGLSYTFDPVGNIKQIKDTVNSNTQSFSYDHLNRLTSATGPHYNTQTYEYDYIGNMTKKNDIVMKYGEGTAGPHALTSYGNTQIKYDLNGNMITKDDTTYTYDTENRLTQVTIPRVGKVSSQTYQFSEGWNFFSIPYKMIDQGGTPKLVEKIAIKDLLKDIEGKYDQISKYDKSINDPNTGHWQHYVGNIKFDQFPKIDNEQDCHFTYGEGYLIYVNTPCSITLKGSIPDTAQPKSLNNGWNLVLAPTDTIMKPSNALKGITFNSLKVYNGSTYDDASILEAGKAYWLHVSSAQDWAITTKEDITMYTYDGDGGRVARTQEDRTTIYIGSSYEILIDNTTGDVLKYKKLIHMGSTRVCEVEQIGENTPRAFFTHADHIGSSNVITDDTGSRVSLFEYKPFGSVAYAAEDNTYDTDKRFTGKTYDSSSGLHYYGARYYDSELCRFITADPTIQHPYDPQDFNRYAYCRNNPVKYIDPTGYGWWDKLWGNVVAGVAGILAGIINPVLGVAVYSALSAGISAMQSGANFWAAAGIGLAAGIVGAAAGFAAGAYAGTFTFTKGVAWGASLIGGMAAGAAGGATGALLTSGNVGMGALSGAAAGATMGAFSGIGGELGSTLGKMFGMPLAGVAGAAVSGGNLGEGAISGAAAWYGSVITSTIANATDNWKHRARINRKSNKLTPEQIRYIKNKHNLTTDESIIIAKGEQAIFEGLADIAEYIVKDQKAKSTLGELMGGAVGRQGGLDFELDWEREDRIRASDFIIKKGYSDINRNAIPDGWEKRE